MCGRFVSAQDPDRLITFFAAKQTGSALDRNWNVAPTEQIYSVRESDKGRELTTMRWGLVPHWAKALDSGPAPINARSETVAEKPMFKSAFRHRRCLIPADGFYEWQKQPGGPKVPFYITLSSGDPMAIAGIWSEWHPSDSESEAIESCAILTTRPNSLLAPIHDRMPVLIAHDNWTEWLDPGNDSTEELADLLTPAKSEDMEAWEVSRQVNNPKSSGARLIERV